MLTASIGGFLAWAFHEYDHPICEQEDCLDTPCGDRELWRLARDQVSNYIDAMQGLPEERERAADDLVLSTRTAAELMGVTRQAVDRAVREGRYPGFRDPVTSRIWVDRRWVEANAPGGAQLLARVEALEGHMRALQEAEQSGHEGVGHRDRASEPDGAKVELLEEITTVKTVNLELLAAAKEQAKAERLLDAATRDEEAGRRKRRRAAAAQRRAREHYLEALSHTQLPGSTRGLGRP